MRPETQARLGVTLKRTGTTGTREPIVLTDGRGGTGRHVRADMVTWSLAACTVSFDWARA